MVDINQIEEMLGIKLTWYQKQMFKVVATKPYMDLVYPRHFHGYWLRKELDKELHKILELDKEDIDV